MSNTLIDRRRFLQAGLGAGAGLALWELYRLGMGDKFARAGMSSRAFKDIGLDEDRLGRLVALALERGGDYADVFLESSMSSAVGYDGERFTGAGMELIGGVAIRVVAGDNTVLRATGDMSWESLTKLAREVASAARAGASGSASVPRLRPLASPNLYAVSTPAFDEPVAAKLDYLKRLAAAAKAADPSVRDAQVNYRDTLRLLGVATSTGVVAYDTCPVLKVGVAVRVAKEGSKQVGSASFSGGGHYGFEYFREHSPELLASRAFEIARSQLDAVEAPSGELPVVLGPAYSGVLLHEAVGHGLEADFNVKGYSYYSGRIGQQVASPLCTIYDDGRRPSLNGSINFDDEGVASSSIPLIERGRLVGYMHSRETAARMKANPTGNGRRQGFAFPPLPRMTNTYLQAGDSDPADIIRSVKRGVYARAFAGGSVNITTGDFTFVPTEAYLIEDGRMTAPLANVLLMGNGPDIMNRISMVGYDMEISDNLWECGKNGQMIPVTVGTPTVRIDALTVGGTLRL
jgi:TldD protein